MDSLSDLRSLSNLTEQVQKEERFLASTGDRIYLVVLSTYFWKMIEKELKSSTDIQSGYKSKEDFTVRGYEVKVIQDLRYTEPVKFIAGRKGFG